MTIQVVLEDSFAGHQGNDLFDTDKNSCYRNFKVKKTATLLELLETLSEGLVCVPYTIIYYLPNSFELAYSKNIHLQKVTEHILPSNGGFRLKLCTDSAFCLTTYDKATVILIIRHNARHF